MTDSRQTSIRRCIWGLLLHVAVAAGFCILEVGCSTEPKSDTRGNSAATIPLSTDDRAKGHVTAAEGAVRRGDKDTALAEFARAIEINPRLTTAYLGMSDIYRMDRNYSKAQEGYARAATIEPGNFDAQYYNGLMLQLMDRVSEAIASYINALRIRPNDFQANLNLATAYYQLDENTQAMAYGRKAVELQPRSGPARFNLGAIYAAMDRHREAVQEYQQAAELMELTPALLLNLSESYGRLQRYEEMRNTLEQLLRSDPSAAAYERLGFAQFQMRQFDDAMASFDKSLQVDPDYTPALNGVGVSQLNRWIKSDYKDAAAHQKGIAALRRSLKANPNQPKILELVTRYSQ